MTNSQQTFVKIHTFVGNQKMHTQTLEYIYFWLPDWKILTLQDLFVHFSIYLSIPHCVYCWRFMAFCQLVRKMPFIISSLCVFLKGKEQYPWSWPSALLLCYQVSLATHSLPPLLQGKQKVLSHVSIASVILSSGDCSFCSQKKQCPSHFSVMFFVENQQAVRQGPEHI